MPSTTFAICLIDRLNAASRWKLFGRSGGGGGRIIFSLSPRRSFFIFWRILCQFSMQINSKNFFLAQNFSTREVFYPGKRLAKCALPSRQCVCVRECGCACEWKSPDNARSFARIIGYAKIFRRMLLPTFFGPNGMGWGESSFTQSEQKFSRRKETSLFLEWTCQNILDEEMSLLRIHHWWWLKW